MFFAVDTCQVSVLRSQLIDVMRASAPDEHWFALIDRAFDHERPEPWRWPHDCAALYRQSGAAEAISPTFLQLSEPASEAIGREVDRLLRHAQGRPMLSFVQTRLTLTELRDAWQNMRRVHTQDGTSFLLRMADTRVSSAMPNCLNPGTWATLCNPLLAWRVIDRRAGWQALPMPDRCADAPSQKIFQPEQAVQHESQPFSVDDGEFARLLDAALPDVLIGAMHERVPDVLHTCDSRSGLYDLMVRVCRKAQEHDIERLDDQIALGVAACLTAGQLLSHTELDHVLVASKRQADAPLVDALMALLPSDTTSEEQL